MPWAVPAADRHGWGAYLVPLPEGAPETAHPGLGQGNGTESWDSHVSSQLLSARLLRGARPLDPDQAAQFSQPTGKMGASWETKQSNLRSEI